MLILVYKINGRYSRSITTAVLVDEVEVDEFPEDQIAFAEYHGGGDFIEIAVEETVGV